MALNFSEQLSQRVVKRSLSSIKNVLTEIVNENLSIASSVQSITLVLGKNSTVNCSNIILSNISHTNISALSKTSDNSVVDVSQKISNIIESDLKNEVEQMNTGFAFGLFNISTTISQTFVQENQKIRESIISKFRDTVSQTENNNQSISLELDVGAELIGEDCSFENISELSILSKMFAKHTVDTVLNLESMSQIKETFDNRSVQKNEGLDFNILGGVFVVILVVVLLIIFLIK